MLFYSEVHRVASLYVYTTDLERWLFIVGGSLAFFSYRAKTYAARCWMLAPQQYLLISTAGAVIFTIANKQYPDGTQSTTITHAFLAADQGVYILLAALHLLLFFDVTEPEKNG